MDCYEVLQSRHQIFQFSGKGSAVFCLLVYFKNNASLICAQAILSLVQVM